MRILLTLALLPALVHAEEIQFTVTGGIIPMLPFANPPVSIWNGPGPLPTSFQETFLVNTLAPGNTLSYGFEPDGSLGTVSFSVIATDFDLTLDGKVIEANGTGSFSASGDKLGTCGFIGGFYGASTSAGTWVGVPDFGLGAAGCMSKAALVNSSDPLGLLLNGSGYFPDDGWNESYFYIDNSTLIAVESVTATGVPEPATLGLMALGFAGVGFVRRRRSRFPKNALAMLSGPRLPKPTNIASLNWRSFRRRCSSMVSSTRNSSQRHVHERSVSA